MAQFKFILWFIYWYLQERDFEFDWDKGNATKSTSKHRVSIDEVESMFNTRLAAPLGRQVSPDVDKERLCIVGPTHVGRMLSVVFTIRDGRVRPISS
jgi:uncharacterized DUF497 family protein